MQFSPEFFYPFIARFLNVVLNIAGSSFYAIAVC